MSIEKSSFNKKKFIIQLLIALSISLFFQFILDPLVYTPYVRAQLSGFFETENSIVICSLSMWFFSFAFAFFYYKNSIITNYLVCSFIPLLLIVGIEFSFFLYYDFLHIPPLIVVGYILWNYRATLRLYKIAFTSVILVAWATLVRLLGTNYTGVPLFPLGLIAIVCWPLINVLFIYILLFLDKRRSAEVKVHAS
ncbi:MAG: hypothetical protein ACTSRS_10415 [Candidatus Helarchaeota archaeon]